MTEPIQLPDLSKRWEAFGDRRGWPSKRSATLRDLLAWYSADTRHYHNARHIAHCLWELDAAAHWCADADQVEAAIWFHDAVYDPRGHQNEEQSGGLAVTELSRLGEPADFCGAVTMLILDTRHTDAPAAPDGDVLVDIDLAILGRPADEFDVYDTAIRAEYSWVGEADYIKGRSALLQRFLNRPQIYRTAFFRNRYEAAARANLARTLAKLTAAATGL